MFRRLRGSILRFLATPLGFGYAVLSVLGKNVLFCARFPSSPLSFNIYAAMMYTDPALLVALSVVGVERVARFIAHLV